MLENAQDKQRMLHLDILRCISIFLVIFNHTNERGYFLFSITENPITQPIYASMSILCSIAVPVFFMVSGALLLAKEEKISTLYRKRVLRILLVILVFSSIQQLYFILVRRQAFSLRLFWETIISGKIIIPYWYLYAYLAFLIMLPFIRRLAQGIGNKEFQYLLCLFFVFSGLMPYICYFTKINGINLTLPILESTIFYPLAGYYLEHRVVGENKKAMGISITLSILSIIVMYFMTMKRAMDIGELSEYGNGIFLTGLIGVPALTIFYLVKCLCRKLIIGNIFRKFIIYFSSVTFGIYLLEERIRESTVFVDTNLAPIIGNMPACIVWILLILVISGGITVILKKVPGIKGLL